MHWVFSCLVQTMLIQVLYAPFAPLHEFIRHCCRHSAYAYSAQANP